MAFLSCVFDVMENNAAFLYFALHLISTAVHKIPVLVKIIFILICLLTVQEFAL